MSRVVIFANGVLNQPDLLRRHLRPTDRIFCADGGTRHALAMGLTPEVIVGDLDSLDPDLRAELAAAGVRFEVHPVRKDETDLELAIGLAIAEGATQVNLLAVLGGRLDQSLANLMLLTRPEWDSGRVRVIEGDEIAWPVRGGQTETIEGSAGDTLSLVPLTPQVTGVTLQGVEWPLHKTTLRFGSTLTVSNVLTEPTARLEVENGLLLVIHKEEHK
jgi:thiamine pyrophosphokinase